MADAAVVIWGELLWDRFPDGDQLGGAPANVAWHLGQAGGWARLVTRVGDDPDGHRALAAIADLVDTELCQLDPERATGEVAIALVETPAGHEPRYTLVPGRAWERIACTDEVRDALSDASVLCYGTLSQRSPEGLASWRAAIAAAPAACLRACDPNLRPRADETPSMRAAIAEALDAADVIKVGDRELAALGALYGWTDPLAALRAGRPRVIALTHGADGATLYAPDRVIEIAATRAAPGGDNVGCGDAFLAILVHGLTSGWDLEAAGRAASRWGAAVAGARGATPRFDEATIASLLEGP
jgi:fructokinase